MEDGLCQWVETKMTEKEKTLLAGCLNGDKAAWDALVLLYSKLAYSTIRKTLTLHHTLAQDDIVEDLHQDFFLSLCENDFRKLRQFRGDRGCSLASWLTVIAARLTIDFLRNQRPTSVEVADAVAQGDSDPGGAQTSAEQEKLLAEAIQTLSPRDRILIDLAYRRGLPPEEIAAVLKTSVNAVYTYKSRVLDKIRAILRTSGSL